MYKKGKTQNGITLIALVITIMVMLILVGVTISMAVNGGLFDYAGKAVGDTQNALKQEQQLINDIIDEYIKPNASNTVETIPTTTSYVGYYADIDGDGEADGVIYADLLKPIENGIYYEYSYTYGEEVVTPEEVKDYYVNGSYIGEFGTKDVIKATGEGKERFYVMSLEDVITADYTTFYWYYNAWEKMDASDTSTAFGTGELNTETIKEIWDANTATPYGTQHARDLWGQIDLSSEWFIPSRGEWLAFADAFDITSSNYSSTYGLSVSYWSSSQADDEFAWAARFSNDWMYSSDVQDVRNIRLSAKF